MTFPGTAWAISATNRAILETCDAHLFEIIQTRNNHITMRTFQIKHILFLLLLLAPALSFAGEIFGTLKKDGKPLVNQEVKIIQNGNVLATLKTDEKGYFSTVIKQIGKCSIELTGYTGATFEVFSTNNSTGYTLSLIKAGDKWELKKM